MPTYDANGNQTLVKTATGIWTALYDANNRPVSFEKTEGETVTVVECGYDYQGRRYMKKVTVNGTVTLYHRYIYRGYLQVACCDLKRSAHPCLWLITWDPAEGEATRPLAIQKDGTWYTYGLDITRNVWEVFSNDGHIRTTYDYAPYGGVKASGTASQPLQWSSEVYDAELAMVYYNFRHYNPMDGRWINRDPIAEEGGWNLYGFVKNSFWVMDGLGRYPAPLDKKILPVPIDGRNNPRMANVDFKNGRRMTIYGITKTSEIPHINELYIKRADIKCILIKDDLLPQHPRIDVTYFYDKNYNPQDPRSGYRDRQGRNVVEHEDVHVSIEIEEWNSLIKTLEKIRSKRFQTEEETGTAYEDLSKKRQDYNATATRRHEAHDKASGSPQH